MFTAEQLLKNAISHYSDLRENWCKSRLRPNTKNAHFPSTTNYMRDHVQLEEMYEGACASCVRLDGDIWVARTMQVRDCIDSELFNQEEDNATIGRRYV
ncbi:hypothetical protein ABEB36_008217 [Hypothenemus hampei]|uniref:Uncharacterized protein n=1 Tax=Hypothenemus hampei TaxID=57062 RepID=A0ABD1EL95_HYPHA